MEKLMKILGRGLVASLLVLVLGAGTADAQVNAYVVSQGSGSVKVIDTATNTETASITVSGPRTLTLSPDGQFLYATTSNGMAKIDTATNTILGTVATGSNPIGIAVTSNGATAYVANNASATVSAVDTATMTVTATLPISSQAIATAPDGTSIWVGSNLPVSPFPAVMAIIDSATNTYTTVPLGHGSSAPSAIAFTPDGAFAYLGHISNFVSVVDTATLTEQATISVPSFQQGLAVSPDGAFVYAPNLLSNSVSVIATATNTVVATVPVGAFPRELAVTPDGAFVYVTNYNSSTVSVIDTATLTVVSTISVPSPWGIAMTPSNTPPNCSGAAPSVAKIWPPDHSMVPVSVQGVTDPDGDPVSIQISQVRQDEPTNGSGDGNTCPDAQGFGIATTSVRAERSGQGNGRVYTLTFTATDDKGATCQGSVKVCVPHSSNGTCVDNGPQFGSTVCSKSAQSAMSSAHSHKSTSNGLNLICGSHYPTPQCDLWCDAGVLLCP